MQLKPLAFLSYAHVDDEYHDGAITEFRKRLSLAVRVHAGVDFAIFQDRESIEWGQNWRETLDATLGEVGFLIPILTPSFFGSEECRKELQAFLDHEAAAGRNDLVLPIHYVTCSVLEDPAKREKDPLASALSGRQYRDWRQLRHEPLTSPKGRQALETLALEIDRALRRRTEPAGPAETRNPATSRAPKPERPPGSADPDDLSAIRDGDFAPELIVLPQGDFMMGSPEPERRWAIEHGELKEWLDRETPQHRVRMGYRVAVGRYPVTFAEWDRYAEDDRWHRSRDVEPYIPRDQGWGRGKRPVINVSWDDVQGYLGWLSGKTGRRYRLLSEAEWEYACRAGTTTAYHVGPGVTHYDANFGKKVGKTVDVGSYTANDWGLCDMHGNVCEWVQDCWNDDYEGAPDDGSAWTSGDCARRVLRGGSWLFSPASARSASRGQYDKGNRDHLSGFRVASSLSRSESVIP